MISGRALLAGVAGWPISHSLSPALHGFWIEQLKLDAAYVPLAIQPDDFAQALAVLPRLGFRGINVTLPHKEAAFRHSSDADDAARATGAANTIVFREGRSFATNTDVAGFLGSLDDGAAGDVAGCSALVLGAGGAARAVIFGLLSRGAAQVTVVNRTRANADALAHFFGKNVVAAGWDQLDGALVRCDLLVNTTKLGMQGQDPLIVNMGGLRPESVVVDIVYRPLETQLLHQARLRGNRTIDGLGMLLHQAAPAFHAWFGVRPDVTPELRAHLISFMERQG